MKRCLLSILSLVVSITLWAQRTNHVDMSALLENMCKAIGDSSEKSLIFAKNTITFVLQLLQ